MLVTEVLHLRRAGQALTFACLMVMTTLILSCSRKDPPPAPPAPPQVGVITLHSQPVIRTTELPGRTTAILTSEVRPQVSGVILKRLFIEGGDVKEGQQLYQIDPSIYRATYDSALATLAHDKAALATAEAKSARYKPLVAAQAVSEQDNDDAVAAAEEARADIAVANANIEQALINLRYTKVLAPIAGTIGRSAVTPGALVTADQDSSMATVTQLDPIYVDLNESSTTLLRLRREMAAGELESQSNGAVKVTLKLEDGSTYPVAGTLQFAEVEVDEGTGTVLVRAVFPNPQHLLLPGMYVHAELDEGINRNGLLVPQQAVSRNTRGDATVLVVGQDKKAVLRVIQAGPAIGDQWVVTGGLRPGEHVIVDGLENVQAGMTVTPVAEDSATPANNTKR
jgi:membrane fusion protein, multidrug efflux system